MPEENVNESDLKNNQYKICRRCQVRHPLTEFTFFVSTNCYNSYCSRCNSERTTVWVQNNVDHVANRTLKYNSSERGFIVNSFARIFKPTEIDTTSKNIAFNRSFGTLGHLPNFSKAELWAELILYVQHMKDRFPHTNGRLCRYCLQPWTYVRGRPNTKIMGRGNKTSGGKSPRTKTWTNFSVDRFDNTKSYVKGNIVFCCAKCNATKQASTRDMWIRFLEVEEELARENNHE